MTTKYKTKERVNFSINKEIYVKFRKVTNDKSVNKSKLIEKLINDWIKNNE